MAEEAGRGRNKTSAHPACFVHRFRRPINRTRVRRGARMGY